MSYDTREQWLRAATEAMRPWLAEIGVVLPDSIATSVGFAKYGPPRSIGQCWNPSSTPGGVTSVFICPTLSEPVKVLDVLLHELVHAGVGTEAGHKGLFVKAVRQLGLKGKPTATYAEEGGALYAKLHELAVELGPYPHSPIIKSGPKRAPGGGWVKLMSIQDENYIIRISPKAFKENGVPTDPWGEKMVEAE